MILVTGATGNVGRPLLEQLQAAGSPVRALARRPDRVATQDGVEIVRGDLERPSTLTAALDGIERVFLMAPTPQLACCTANICDIAPGAGVRHIVVLSSSIVELGRDDELSTAHRKAERTVTQSGLAWTFLRPGAFMSNTLDWAKAIKSGEPVRLLAGNYPAAPIDPADIAAVAHQVLQSDEHIGATYSLTGPEQITPGQQIGALTELLGRQPLFDEASEQDALAILTETRDRRQAASLLNSLRRPDVPWAEPLPTVERLIRRAPTTFRCWARSHIQAFL